MQTCPDCGARYSGTQRSGGHCRAAYGGCCRTFANDATATAHMVGPFNPPGLRRCLTEDEMTGRGWWCGDRGWSKSKPMTDEDRKRLPWIESGRRRDGTPDPMSDTGNGQDR